MIFLEITDLLVNNDFVVGFFYIVFLFIILKRYKNKKYKNLEIGKYFIPAFSVKVIGCCFLLYMQQVIYKNGDTFVYFEGVTYINEAFSKNVGLGIELITSSTKDFSPAAQSAMGIYANIPVPILAIMRVGGVLSLFFGNLYFPIALTITLFSFLGCWRLYLFFIKFYPTLYNPLAYACLFIPSTFLWGTGLQKDPICIGFIGFLTFASYKILIKRKRIIMNSVIIFISAYIILQIKTYILLAYVPFLLLFYYYRFTALQKSKVSKYAVSFFLLVITAVGIYYSTDFIEENFTQYAGDAVLENLVTSGNVISEVGKNDGGSVYSIGEIDPSIMGIVKVIPGALVVTLFRPFLWEFRKVIDLPAIFESLFTLYFTLKVFFAVGFRHFFAIFFKNKLVLFSLGFAIVFSIIAGISSGTFGTLSRYKIPGLPFYFVGLIIILHEGRKKTVKAQ